MTTFRQIQQLYKMCSNVDESNFDLVCLRLVFIIKLISQHTVINLRFAVIDLKNVVISLQLSVIDSQFDVINLPLAVII